jgi:hypothetical protein
MDQFGYAQLLDRSKLRHNKDMEIELSNFDDLMITKMCILSGTFSQLTRDVVPRSCCNVAADMLAAI